MVETEFACSCTSIDLFNFGCRCVARLPLKVWYNGMDWVIARDLEEARQICRDIMGYGDDAVDGDEGWSVLDDDREITIHDTSEGIVSSATTTLTAKEWVNEVGKPEYLASREY